MLGIDTIYWLFAIPGLLLSLFSQFYVKSTYSKYSKVDSGRGITGMRAAVEIKNGENLPVEINANQQALGDHFDPAKNVVNLDSGSAQSTSVATVAVSSHEMGHVQQKFTSSLIYGTRRFLVPVTNIGTNIGYVLFFIGLAIARYELSKIGLIFFSTSVLFSLVTIPVELNASSRAMGFIKKYDLVSEENRGGARKVLTAAALTYFAGLATSILNLLYYVSILGRRKD